MNAMFRFLKKSQLVKRDSSELERSVEEDLREATEKERLDEELQEVREARAPKKRKVESERVVVLPPMLARNERQPGGKPKPAGVVFSATYDDAPALGKTLAKLEKLTKSYTLLFTERGLGVTVLERSRVMLVTVDVPCASFARYTSLAEGAVTFVVSANTIKQLGAQCEALHTLTFSYDQCALASEPLHLMLYPHDGDPKTNPVVRLTLPPLQLDDPVGAMADHYQYRVRMSAALFHKTVVALARASDTITLMLSADAFEMAALSGESQHTLSYHISTQKDAAALTDKTCTIERIAASESRVTMSQLRNYRLSAAYLESAASFGATGGDEVVLRLGVLFYDDTHYDEQPLHLHFPLRAASLAPFSVDVYIAAKVNEE